MRKNWFDIQSNRNQIIKQWIEDIALIELQN